MRLVVLLMLSKLLTISGVRFRGYEMLTLIGGEMSWLMRRPWFLMSFNSFKISEKVGLASGLESQQRRDRATISSPLKDAGHEGRSSFSVESDELVSSLFDGSAQMNVVVDD